MFDNNSWIDAAGVFGMSEATALRQTKESLIRRHRALARAAHPDGEGGDEEEMKRINAAYDVLMEWLKAGKPAAGARSAGQGSKQDDSGRHHDPDPPPSGPSYSEPDPPRPRSSPQERTNAAAPTPEFHFLPVGVGCAVIIGAALLWFLLSTWLHGDQARGTNAIQEVEDSLSKPLSSLPMLASMSVTTQIPDGNGTILIYDRVPAVFEPDIDDLLRKFRVSPYIHIQLTRRPPGLLKNIDVEPYTLGVHAEFLPPGPEGAAIKDKLHAYYAWLGELGTAGQRILICRYEKLADESRDYRVIYWFKSVHPLFVEPLQRKGDLFKAIKGERSTCPLISKYTW